MSAKTPPPPPPPPPPAGAATPPPAPAAAPVVDHAAAIKELIPERCFYDNKPLATEEQIEWCFNTLQARMPDLDLERLHNWIRSSTQIEMNQDRAAAQSNPVSDTPTDQQQAKPDPNATKPKGKKDTGKAPMPTDPKQLAAYDRIAEYQCKSLRGLKSRLTKTHETPWKDYCTQFGLDEKTGLPAEAAQEASTVAPDIPPTDPPASPDVPPVTGPAIQPPKDQQVQADPSLEGQQTTMVAFADAVPEQSIVVAQYPSDPQAAATTLVPAVLMNQGVHPAVLVAALESYFSMNVDGVGPDEADPTSQVAVWLASMQQKGHITEVPADWVLYAVQAMPAASAETAPEPQNDLPTYQPPTPQPTPAADPVQAGAEAIVTAAAEAAPELVSQAQELANKIEAGGGITPPAPVVSGEEKKPSETRMAFVEPLGGPVDLIIVNVNDLPNVDLSMRVDVNALVGLAEEEGLRQVTDPERLKYREDRRVAQAVFSKYLCDYKELFVIQNGFNWILPDEFVAILMRRVVSGSIIKQGKVTPFAL